MKIFIIYCVPAQILYLGKNLVTKIHAFFISIFFTSNTRLKLTKNQANAKQHPEAELLLFENYSTSSSMLSSITNIRYL